MNVKEVAVGTQEMPVQTKLTVDERESERDMFIEKASELQKLQNELDDIKASFKEQMKPIQREQADRLDLITKGYREEKKVTYQIPDEEAGMMTYLLESGEEVFRRKLTPDEYQKVLPFQSAGKAAN